MSTPRSLTTRLIFRSLFAFILVAVILFIPAVSFRYWQGWVFMAILFLPLPFTSIFFFKRDPPLGERLLRTQDKVSHDPIIISCPHLTFLLPLLSPALPRPSRRRNNSSPRTPRLFRVLPPPPSPPTPPPLVPFSQQASSGPSMAARFSLRGFPSFTKNQGQQRERRDRVRPAHFPNRIDRQPGQSNQSQIPTCCRLGRIGPQRSAASCNPELPLLCCTHT